MRLIQRNLFPRRPPSAKCDGPSILKTSSSSGAAKPSPIALKALLQKTSTLSTSDQNTTALPSSTQQAPPANLNASTCKLPQPPPSHPRPTNRAVHPLSKSASLSSLLQPTTRRSTRKCPSGNVQGSQDSFHVSDSSSPSLSLSSSSGSLSGGGSGRNAFTHSGVIPAHSGAISRRSIVSRSEAAATAAGRRASLEDNSGGTIFPSDEVDVVTTDQQDCWVDIEKLVADHVGEILSKWDQIDDEIWAKVVVMERNRRVAKAYARTPVLTIAGGNGSSAKLPSSSASAGFNGHRVQLSAFANAHRDRTVRAAIRAAGDGLLVQMDEEGNLLGKRASEKSEVNLLKNDLGPKQQSKPAKISAKNSVLLFDMAAFRSALEKEVLGNGGIRKPRNSSAAVEKARTALQAKCFVFLSFGSVSSSSSSNSGSSLLKTPVWAILVNLVALEMLFSSLPTPLFNFHQTENFYSLPAMTNTGKSGDQQRKQQQNNQKSMFMNASVSSSSSSTPPKLPPRDLQHAKPPLTLPEPDYDEEDYQRSVDDMADLLSKNKKGSRNKNNFQNCQGLASKPQQSYNDEDLYFLGYSAHVSTKLPNATHSTLLSGGGNTSTASRSAKNPPIVRKKFWSQSGGNSSSGSGSGSSHWKFFGNSSKPFQPVQNNRQIQTLDYRNSGNPYNTSSGSYYSSSRPSSAYYYSTSASQLLLPPYSYTNSNSAYNSSSGVYADNNNSIYGVNTSLLRRTMQYQQIYQQQQQAMSRSVSSPSLRNIIFFNRGGGGGKKGPQQKDFNNNRIF